ncbi:MAG: LysM peptidoglycan-binding domain-containing protein [Odoribacter sp.]|nr:LysM peptidoglycan-binding domain-containing protein [Odoribacter sp.]
MRFLTLPLILLVCFTAKAQTIEENNTENINFIELDEPVSETFLKTLEEAYIEWRLSQREGIDYVDSAFITEGIYGVHPIPDSLYILRLDSLNSAIPLSYNNIVKRYIEHYTVKARHQVASMLGASEYYFPIFEEILMDKCMPVELKYVAIIESALNPVARSRADARGLWQFMAGTAKMYKLEMNSFIDERYDPVKSSQAAIQHLWDLYSIYDDWFLAIAAYNCGAGNVNKAIRRTGGKRNYWDIYDHLPKETRGYVPTFIAAMYVFNYYKEHNIYPIKRDLPLVADTLILNEALHFDQIAGVLDIPVDEIKRLNPQYTRNVIPAGYGKSYSLCLPYQHIASFIDNQDTIFAYNRDHYFNNKDRLANPNDRFKNYAQTTNAPNNKVKITYTVKSGDVIGAIATKYKVRTADLKSWNNLNNKLTIRVGQKLAIYVSPERANELGYGTSQTLAANNNAGKAPEVETIDGEYIYYTVKKGESLWTIAQKYPGISNQDIMRWNGLTENTVKKIKPGQKLKIKI